MDFGQPLSFKKTSNGQPSFNVAFDYEAEVFWMMTYETALSKVEFNQLPEGLNWNLWSARRQGYIGEWNPIRKRDLKTGMIQTVSRRLLAEIMPWQRQIKWVVAVSTVHGYQPIYHADLGELCQQYQNRFFDVARKSASCDVDPRVTSGWEQECHQFSANLAGQVTSGMISCRWAGEAFARQGCGLFVCPNQEAVL